MTREEATTILSELVEQVEAKPELHRRLWQAITVLNEPAADESTANADVAP